MIYRCTSQLHHLAVMALIALTSYVTPVERASAESAKPTVVHQLRTYEIVKGRNAAFHTRFREHAMRIMARHGFKIVATWESTVDERVQFVYLLEWPDETTMRDRWTQFLADDEWTEIKRESARTQGRLMGTIEERVLHLTDYSPHRTLLD